MIATLIPFAVTILITFTFCILARRSFGECIVATLYSISVILYLSQYLLGTFSPGLWLLAVLGVVSVPLCFLRNGGASENIKYLVSNCGKLRTMIRIDNLCHDVSAKSWSYLY